MNENDRNAAVNLIYPKEPIEALRECQARYVRSETKYREMLYQLLATVYANALLIVDVDHAVELFYQESYWKRERRWQVRNRRDFFRDVCKYVVGATTTEERKIASKYATVLWHLGEAHIPTDGAASAILCCGGIEAIARRGLVFPAPWDPQGANDEDSRENQREPENTSDDFIFENAEGLGSFLNSPEALGAEKVNIVAEILSSPEGPTLRLVSFAPTIEQQSNVSTPGLDDLCAGDPDLNYVGRSGDRRPLVIDEVNSRFLARVLRMEKGQTAIITIEQTGLKTSGWRCFRARRLRPPARRNPKPAGSNHRCRDLPLTTRVLTSLQPYRVL
jgi:hypothetical protein